MTFKRAVMATVACLATAMVAGGCGGDDEGGGGGGGGAIKVGGIFDLTGATSDVGVAYANGIKARVEQLNAEGGIDGTKIDLISDDYAYEVPQAEQLYSRLKSEQVVAIQGWGTGDTEALSPSVTRDKIPYLSASYSENVADPAETPFNFVPGMTYSDQMRAVLDFIAEKDPAASVAVFHNDSPFGESPLEDGQAHIEDQGYDISYETIAMPAEATDYGSELSSISDADYIIIQNVATPSAQLAKDVKRSGSDAQIMCLVYCSDEVYTKLAGDAANGTIGIFPFSPVSDGAEGLAPVADAIGSAQKLEASNVHFVQGYYTMEALVQGIQAAVEGGEVTGDTVRTALEELEALDTQGVSAPLDWTAESHAGLASARLYEFQDGTWTRMSGDFVTPAGAE